MGAQPNGHTTFSEKNNLRYLQLVRKYSSIILGQFFGHLHSDSFRIIYNDNGEWQDFLIHWIYHTIVHTSNQHSELNALHTHSRWKEAKKKPTKTIQLLMWFFVVVVGVVIEVVTHAIIMMLVYPKCNQNFIQNSSNTFCINVRQVSVNF